MFVQIMKYYMIQLKMLFKVKDNYQNGFNKLFKKNFKTQKYKKTYSILYLIVNIL